MTKTTEVSALVRRYGMNRNKYNFVESEGLEMERIRRERNETENRWQFAQSRIIVGIWHSVAGPVDCVNKRPQAARTGIEPAPLCPFMLASYTGRLGRLGVSPTRIHLFLTLRRNRLRNSKMCAFHPYKPWLISTTRNVKQCGTHPLDWKPEITLNENKKKLSGKPCDCSQKWWPKEDIT